jgi:ribosomal RNA-processing protein 9
LWKIVEETQLVFRGGGGEIASLDDLVAMEELKKDRRRDPDHGRSGGSMDVVAMVDENHFLTGSDTG